MGRAFALLAAGAATLAAGCTSDRGALDQACTQTPAAVRRALQRAPGAVRLGGTTPLSRCVERALDDVSLGNVGAILTDVADGLARTAPRDPSAALRLGYLVGATERGARHGNGVQAELVSRMGAFMNVHPGPASLAALRRGRAAGRARG